MGLSPAAARRRLGAELRTLRERAGKKVEDAAKTLDCSTAKISRLENGKGVPYPRDVRDLVALYGADGELDHVVELAEDGRAQDWFDDFRDVLQGEMFAEHMIRYAALERDAAVIKWFEAELVPGLLQTEEYIDSVSRAVFPARSDKDRARFVEFRVQRQGAVLRRGTPLDLSFAVGELAIMRGMGDAGTLRRQLDALVAELEGPLTDVDFRLTPLTAATPAVLGGPFIILRFADPTDQDVVYQEGRDGATYLESDREVQRYTEKFRSLQEHSLSRADSLQRLAQHAERLG